MDLNGLWKTTNGLPVVGGVAGKKLFSMAFSQVAPYFATIGATVTVLEPNHVELKIRNRRKVHNHIGTVHAIALCNGLEMAMGALAEVTIPKDKRWIPKGMSIAYTAMANTDITCVAETDPDQWQQNGELAVRVKGVREDGTNVIEGTITLWISDKKPKADKA
jgi:acyl-coenzyme A thioesterase PaaI-like protein